MSDGFRNDRFTLTRRCAARLILNGVVPGVTSPLKGEARTLSPLRGEGWWGCQPFMQVSIVTYQFSVDDFERIRRTRRPQQRGVVLDLDG